MNSGAPTKQAILLALLLLTLAGCNASANIPPTITVMHDDQHEVTCWLSNYNGANSIACLPNSMIEDADDRELDPMDSAGTTPTSSTTVKLNTEIFGL